jgi:hypothetical protein
MNMCSQLCSLNGEVGAGTALCVSCAAARLGERMRHSASVPVERFKAISKVAMWLKVGVLGAQFLWRVSLLSGV